MVDLPTPVSGVDRECFESVLSTSWLRESVITTGRKWGRHIVDVEMSRLPTSLLGQVMLIPSDEKDPDSIPLSDEVRLVVYRWDRYDHLGWSESFDVLLTFPDGTHYEVEVPPSFKLMDGHSVRVSVASTTVVRERAYQVDRKIPRIVFNLSAPVTKQISQDVRRLLKNVRRMNNLLQATSLYLVLEDDACRKEVESSGIPNFAEAYDALRAPSYRADLMRYWLLYKYGGVYLDDKTLMRQSLDSPMFDSIFSGDGAPGHRACDLFICSHLTPEIAFMAARPGSPLMLAGLQTAIANIMRRDYTKHRLGITGNYMFTKVLTDNPEPIEGPVVRSQLATDIGATWFTKSGEMCATLPVIFSNDGILVRNQFLWQRQAIPTSDWPKPASHYTSLWTQRQVYTDGNPPASAVRAAIASPIAAAALHIGIGVSIVLMIGFIISRYPPITWI